MHPGARRGKLGASSFSSLFAVFDDCVPFKIIPAMNLPSDFVWVEFSSEMGKV